MTTSLFSSESLLRTFYEQQRSSQQMFDSLREHLILRLSEQIRPLVKFLEALECDEEEILQAVFEAIAFEKDAELELGTFAFDQRNEWADQCDDQEADAQSQILYRLGVELFRQLCEHRLYRHGFLPYQFTRRHGLDLVATRLGIPEIMHREDEMVGHGLAPKRQPVIFGQMAWRPELVKVLPLTHRTPHKPVFVTPSYVPPQSSESRQHRSAEEFLRPIASVLKEFQYTPEPSTEPPPMTQDEIDGFRQELAGYFDQFYGGIPTRDEDKRE